MFWYELRFLTADENLHVKSSDFKTFKYENKKNQNSTSYISGKKSYCEKRGQNWYIPSKRPAKLKECLHELENHLKDNNVVYCEWRNDSILCMVFSNGLIVYLAIDTHTLDVTRIFFDRYCVGKISQNVTAAIFTETHLLFVYSENLATLITVNPPKNPLGVEKISSREPKYQSLELYGGSRKCERRVSWSGAGEAGPGGGRALVWSPTSPAELFPWSPAVSGEDRANVHLYSLNKSQMTLLCYHRIEDEALSIDLSQLHENIVYSVEQKTYQKDGACAQSLSFTVCEGALRTRSSQRVPLPAPARAASRSPCETRLLLACIDGSIVLHHEHTAITNTVKAAFIPSLLVWGEGVAVVCEERGRVQCLDLSLAPVLHDHAKFIDTGTHLKRQGMLERVTARRRESGPLLLLGFEAGPLAILHITITDIVQRRLREGQMERVMSLLRALSWDTEGDTCLHVLHLTINHLFRKPLEASTEQLIQELLGCFHAPAVPLSERAIQDYGAPVHDLSRRFFHRLLRYGRIDKALSLAVDLGDADLFVDAAHAATSAGLHQLATEARLHAQEALDSQDHSTCSVSSCSQCASDSGSDTASFSECSSAIVPRETAKIPPPRAPPPLPYVPNPTPLEPPLPIPIIPLDPAPVHSIRPNIHQYLDRDSTLWKEVATDYNASALNYNTDNFSTPNHSYSLANENIRIGTQSYVAQSYGASSDNPRNNYQSYGADNQNYNTGSQNFSTSNENLRLSTSNQSKESQSYNKSYYKYEKKPTHKVIDIIPRNDPKSVTMNYNNIYQTELREENGNIPRHNDMEFDRMLPYKSVYGQKSALSNKYGHSNIGSSLSLNIDKNGNNKINGVLSESKSNKPSGEKNKVKFSDTISVAVVPERGRRDRSTGNITLEGARRGPPDPRRELADSLPLCPPHRDYLEDFAPALPPAPAPTPPAGNANDDYIEV